MLSNARTRLQNYASSLSTSLTWVKGPVAIAMLCACLTAAMFIRLQKQETALGNMQRALIYQDSELRTLRSVLQNKGMLGAPPPPPDPNRETLASRVFIEGGDNSLREQTERRIAYSGEPQPVPHGTLNIAKFVESKGVAMRDPTKPLHVVWDFGANGCTGFAMEAMNFVVPFNDTRWGVKMGVIVGDDFCPGIPEDVLSVIKHFRDQPLHEWEIDIFVSHKPSDGYPTWPYKGLAHINRVPKYVIGRSMMEVDRIHKSWVQPIKERANEVWIPARFLFDAFERQGVPREKLTLIPEAFNEDLYDPNVEPMELPIKKGFNFLSVFKWEPRKGWDVLLQAYLEEFKPDEDVALHIQTYLFQGGNNAHKPEVIWRKITRFASLMGFNTSDPDWRERIPTISIMTKELNTVDLPSLYKACDAFVLPTRGEGWGLPIMEAMAMGLPAIATNFSGQTEFMHEDNAYLLKVEAMESAIGKQYEEGQLWGEPDLDHLKQLMRRVFTKRKEAHAVARRGQEYVRKNFNRHAVAKILHRRWMEIGMALPEVSQEWVGHEPAPRRSGGEELMILRPRRHRQPRDTTEKPEAAS